MLRHQHRRDKQLDAAEEKEERIVALRATGIGGRYVVWTAAMKDFRTGANGTAPQ